MSQCNRRFRSWLAKRASEVKRKLHVDEAHRATDEGDEPFISGGWRDFEFEQRLLALRRGKHGNGEDAAKAQASNSVLTSQPVNTHAMLERLRRNMVEAENAKDILAKDLGLDFKDVDPKVSANLGIRKEALHLYSTVSQEDDSFRPRPELWERTENNNSFDDSDPLGDWPARLLHVPSMISYEWHPGNRYDDVQRPRYAILSYTWGRWRLPQSDQSPDLALQVSGVPWAIPAVDEELFTVHEFHHVLRSIAREADTEWVWVDVACIDQREASAQGAKEIGRQAKIFETAARAFIWLLNGQKEENVHTQFTVVELLRGLEIGSEIIFANSFEPNGAGSKQAVKTSPSFSRNRETTIPLEELTDQQRRLWDALHATNFNLLTNVPWFSSLWTLQEAFLRSDASLIDRSGQYITSKDDKPYELDDILEYSNRYYRWVQPAMMAGVSEEEDPFVMEKRVIGRNITNAGLQALAAKDRMMLYTCAKSRQASRLQDRVYGIMQVWRFQLGSAAPGTDSKVECSLNELESQLGKSLWLNYPVESQLQVHSEAIKERQSWRISQYSDVPTHHLRFTETGHLDGFIDRHSSQLDLRRANGTTYAYFKGKMCRLAVLREGWAVNFRCSVAEQGNDSLFPSVQMSLDHTVMIDNFILQYRKSLQNIPPEDQLHVADLIIRHCEKLDRTATVILLASFQQTQLDNSDSLVAIGLITVNAPDETIGGWQKRLGICLWTVPDISQNFPLEDADARSLLDGTSTSWVVDECIFG